MAAPSEGNQPISLPARVLVIEDDAHDVRLIREMIHEIDPATEVVHAASVGEAVPHLRDSSIDAILLDLRLPDARGVEAVAMVHAGGIGKPIVVLSGRSESDLAIEALRLGAQDYVIKETLQPCALARAIQLAVERQRLLECMRDSIRMLHSSEDDLRRLLLQSVDALVVVGMRGRVHFANQHAECMFGRTARELADTPFPIDSAPGRVIEREIVRADGSQLLVEVRCTNVVWRGSAALAVSLRDMSQHRTLAEQDVRLEMLTNCLNNLSHELRTPLSAIYQFVSNVRDGVAGPVNDSQAEQLGSALRNVEEVLGMVGSLLEVARIQSGKLKIDARVMKLCAELHQLESYFVRTARDADVRFDLEIPPDLPALLAEPGRVRQIVSNLFENAIKFTPAGGRVCIAARHEASTRRVLLSVRDTGCGVPESHLERIFEQLHQVPEASHRSRRGLGLGLFITRELVRGLNGDIRVRSEPGHGSEFEISLPEFSWPALLEPLAGDLRDGADAHAITVTLAWPREDADERVPPASVDLLREWIGEALRGVPAVPVPPLHGPAGVQIGAVVIAPRPQLVATVRDLEARLRNESRTGHSGLDIRMRAVRVSSPDRRTTIDALSQTLEKLFPVPNPKGTPCPNPM